MGSVLGALHRARLGREEWRKPPSSGPGLELLSARTFWITVGSPRKAGRGLSNQSVRRVGRRLPKVHWIGRPDGIQGGLQNRSSCGLISASKTSPATPRKDFGLPGVFCLRVGLKMGRGYLRARSDSVLQPCSENPWPCRGRPIDWRSENFLWPNFRSAT